MLKIISMRTKHSITSASHVFDGNFNLLFKCRTVIQFSKRFGVSITYTQANACRGRVVVLGGTRGKS